VTVTLNGVTSRQAVEAIITSLHFNDDTNGDGIVVPTGIGTYTLDYANLNASIGLACGQAHQVTAATGTAYSATWAGLDTSTNFGGVALIAALYPASGAVLDFGAGSNEASVAVADATVLSTDIVKAFFMADDVTANHSGPDHRYAGIWIDLSVNAVSAGVGFTIVGRAKENMTGQFNVRYRKIDGAATYALTNDSGSQFLTNDAGTQQLTGQ
jgi:hypothetical protein